MITNYIKQTEQDQFQIVDDARPGCWIHVDMATNQDITSIAQLINIDVADLIDCIDRFEIPRLETFDDVIIVITRYPSKTTASTDIGLYTTTFAMVLSKDYFITICTEKSALVKNVVNRKSDLLTLQKTRLMVLFLGKITQEYTVNIKLIRSNVLHQEKDLGQIDSDDINAMTIYEENLNQYLSALVPLRGVFDQISIGKISALIEEDQDLIEGLVHAIRQSEDLCKINMRSLARLRNSYQIIFTNQLNKTIKILTALTIILNIPTMIASIYGMNITLPGQESANAFLFIFIVIAASLGAGFFFFKRKKWL
ncbi:MAG: magnesium transporter CorA family protein [Chlamydiia bacterium]